MNTWIEWIQFTCRVFILEFFIKCLHEIAVHFHQPYWIQRASFRNYIHSTGIHFIIHCSENYLLFSFNYGLKIKLSQHQSFIFRVAKNDFYGNYFSWVCYVLLLSHPHSQRSAFAKATLLCSCRKADASGGDGQSQCWIKQKRVSRCYLSFELADGYTMPL